MESGQQALFRVLKAYSLHDLEVGYCQGMAFAAGVLLMYLPEEPTFRVFCRLMDGDGPNLRRLYLPGLDPLKEELARYEWMLSVRQPALQVHLQEHSVPPVLYVSQWLMTVFTTPFSSTFCAQLIDIMLQEDHDHVLLRCSLAIMDQLAEQLLALHDFEYVLTAIKLTPIAWGAAKLNQLLADALSMTLSASDLAAAAQHALEQQGCLEGFIPGSPGPDASPGCPKTPTQSAATLGEVGPPASAAASAPSPAHLPRQPDLVHADPGPAEQARSDHSQSQGAGAVQSTAASSSSSSSSSSSRVVEALLGDREAGEQLGGRSSHSPLPLQQAAGLDLDPLFLQMAQELNLVSSS
ncbi:rab-GTPase-TBC domain-containing protein [Haematococcus lacustris]